MLYIAGLIIGVLLIIIRNNNVKHDDAISELKKKQEQEKIEWSSSYSKLSDASRKNLERLSVLQSSLKEKEQQITDLIAEKDSLQKKLDNLKNIEADSLKMNAPSNDVVEQQLIDQIRKERELKNDPAFVSSQIPPLSETSQQYIPENDDAGTLSRLDREQLNALNLMESSKKNVFITGKAGTGKSFLLKAFYSTTAKKVLKLAPTGIAALNVNGATIHSAFGYENLEKISLEELNPSTLKLNSSKRILLKSIDTLIIDEISIVRVDIFEKIEWILRIINENDRPFGGKQIILFGDLFQLPPVAKHPLNIELQRQYGGIHFFYSNAYHYGNFQFIELTINHRHKKDHEFFNLLNRIREGTSCTEDIALLNSRYVRDSDSLSRTVLTLFPTKQAAEEKNKQELAKIDEPEFCYTARIVDEGSNTFPAKVDGLFPITYNLHLKVGAAIMMVTNDPDKHWVNGTLGIVKSLSEDRIIVVIDGMQYEVYKSKFTLQEATLVNRKIKYVDTLSVIQYPLVLAYAITIHKSQGMTYESIACDINDCFAPGQAYVALSRCTSMNGLYLTSPVQIKSIKVDNSVVDFYQSLQS